MRFQFRNNAAVGMEPALRENAIGGEDRTERHIHAGPTWEAEPSGEDADDGVRHLIQLNCGSHRCPITSEHVTPKFIRQHRHRWTARSLLFGRKQTADEWWSPEHGEELVGHKRGSHAAGAVIGGDETRRAADVGQRFEDIALCAPVAECGIGPKPVVAALAPFPDTEQAIGCVVLKRP